MEARGRSPAAASSAWSCPTGCCPGRRSAPIGPVSPSGVIVKPPLGLSPAGGGRRGPRPRSPAGPRSSRTTRRWAIRPWCPLAERVRAVAKVLEPGVVYCPNVTGPSAGLIDRARMAVDLGATGAARRTRSPRASTRLVALREADLGRADLRPPGRVGTVGPQPVVRPDGRRPGPPAPPVRGRLRRGRRFRRHAVRVRRRGARQPGRPPGRAAARPVRPSPPWAAGWAPTDVRAQVGRGRRRRAAAPPRLEGLRRGRAGWRRPSGARSTACDPAHDRVARRLRSA